MRDCRTKESFVFVLLAAMLLWMGCGNQRGDSSADVSDSDEMEIDWGAEVTLDEMISMAKDGSIVEIQWQVMPNILRATTADGAVYHLRNENKGVDLRSRLIEAGVQVGEGGVQFRHVF
ncbi:MAG: hypothetical protein P8Y80_08290 [Acidobacteriota bacterium]